MKSILNKGIVFLEFKMLKIPFIWMFLCIFIFKSLQIFNIIMKSKENINLLNTKKDFSEEFFYVLEYDRISGISFVMFMIIGCILFSIFQISNEKKSGSFITYLFPIEKTSIMWHKILITISLIFICFLLNSLMIISNLILYKNIFQFVSVLDILFWMIRNMLTFQIIYLVLILIQSKFGEIKESVIFGLVVINIPLILILLVNWLYNFKMIELKIKIHLENFLIFVWPISYTMNDKYLFLASFNRGIFSGGINSNIFKPIQEPFWILKILILISILIFLTLLTLYEFKINKVENINKSIVKDSLTVQILILIISGFSFIALISIFSDGITYYFYRNPITLACVSIVFALYCIAARYLARKISIKFFHQKG